MPTPSAPPSPLPAYSDQSASAGFPYGSNVNLRVDNYTGAIQWWHNGTAITRSTTKYTLVPSSSTLQINNVELSDAGIYQAELLDASPVRQFSIFDITVIGECSENKSPLATLYYHKKVNYNFRVFIHDALKVA